MSMIGENSSLASQALDHATLQKAFRRSQTQQKRRALLLIIPSLLFVVVTFVVPIAQMLTQSVYNPTFSETAPNLGQWFAENGNAGAPDEAAYAALAADLRLMRETRTAGLAGTRINYDVPGARSLFSSTARQSANLSAPFSQSVLAADPRWGDPLIWRAMRAASNPFTADFYLSALDLTRGEGGGIVNAPPETRIYVAMFSRTLVLSATITLICLVLAYPVAHLLARLPLATSNLLMILVLLPFWTSLLVRTTSWIVLLQRNGVINDALVALGLLSEDGRLDMIYNKTGTIIAMTHILLPFMILPLYSVMRSIPPGYVRAARSLGASSWTAFRRVYFPQTLPGVAAGSLLVFILAIGYYITPALVGGASGQLISNLIAFHMQGSLNWSLAAALATLLLVAVLALYWVYDRLVGIDNMKLG